MLSYHSFNKYFLNTYYELRTPLGTGETAVNGIMSQKSWRASPSGERDHKQISKWIKRAISGSAKRTEWLVVCILEKVVRKGLSWKGDMWAENYMRRGSVPWLIEGSVFQAEETASLSPSRNNEDATAEWQRRGQYNVRLGPRAGAEGRGRALFSPAENGKGSELGDMRSLNSF